MNRHLRFASLSSLLARPFDFLESFAHVQVRKGRPLENLLGLIEGSSDFALVDEDDASAFPELQPTSFGVYADELLEGVALKANDPAPKFVVVDDTLCIRPESLKQLLSKTDYAGLPVLLASPAGLAHIRLPAVVLAEDSSGAEVLLRAERPLIRARWFYNSRFLNPNDLPRSEAYFRASLLHIEVILREEAELRGATHSKVSRLLSNAVRYELPPTNLRVGPRAHYAPLAELNEVVDKTPLDTVALALRSAQAEGSAFRPESTSSRGVSTIVCVDIVDANQGVLRPLHFLVDAVSANIEHPTWIHLSIPQAAEVPPEVVWESIRQFRCAVPTARISVCPLEAVALQGGERQCPLDTLYELRRLGIDRFYFAENERRNPLSACQRQELLLLLGFVLTLGAPCAVSCRAFGDSTTEDLFSTVRLMRTRLHHSCLELIIDSEFCATTRLDEYMKLVCTLSLVAGPEITVAAHANFVAPFLIPLLHDYGLSTLHAIIKM